jgi:hypothetical protein
MSLSTGFQNISSFLDIKNPGADCKKKGESVYGFAFVHEWAGSY